MDNRLPQKKGTGSLFQDLLGLTIPLKRCPFPQNSAQLSEEKLHKNKNPLRKRPPLEAKCSICTGVNNLKPFSPEEIAIIGENVSLLNNPGDNFLTWICPPCGSILGELSKLRRKMENITICLRTLVGIRLREQCPSRAAYRDEHIRDTGPPPKKKRSHHRDPLSPDASPNLEIWDPLQTIKVEDDDINISPSRPLSREESDPSDDDDVDYVVTAREEELQSESGEDDDDTRNNVTHKLPPKKRGPRRKLGEPPKHFCPQCGKGFYYNYHLLRHLEREKIPLPINLELPHCEICRENFASEEVLQVHLKTWLHAEAENARILLPDETVMFSCAKCETKYHKFAPLLYHKLKIHSEKIRCIPCDKEYGAMDLYKIHLTSYMHRATLGEVQPRPSQRDRNYKCPLCEKSFFCQKVLRTHELGHVRPLICEICGKTFATSNQLKQHGMGHTNPRVAKIRKTRSYFIPPDELPFPCPGCDKRFQTAASLSRHKKSVHDGRRHKCDLCGKEFLHSFGMARHKNVVHGTGRNTTKPALKRYTCHICEKTFSEKNGYTRHVELIHFLDKTICPYECPDTFESEQEWGEHLEQCKSEGMLGESSSLCLSCGSTFRNELLRIFHHLAVHTSFACTTCDRKFTRQGFLSRHGCSKGDEEEEEADDLE